MIENLSISDLDALRRHLRKENTKLWYGIEIKEELPENAKETLSANEKLIAEIENEMKNRVNNLAQAGEPGKNRSGSKIAQAGEN